MQHLPSGDLASLPLPSSLRDLRVAVAGAGRLGTSLALGLGARGIALCAFTCRTREGARRAEEVLGLPPATSLQDLLLCRPDLILITVPDESLPAVVTDLAGALSALEEEARPAAAHTSGATSVQVLDPLAEQGCLTFAFHPLQTFADPLSGAGRLAGTTFAVTPGPRGGYELGAALAESLEGHPFLLRDEDRPLYHAAAVLASNYLITLVHAAQEMFSAAGLTPGRALQAFLPLTQAAMENVAGGGPAAALTGPLSRGDVTTIRVHLQALRSRRPELLELYKALGLSTLGLVRARGEVHPEVLNELECLLRGIPPQPPVSDESAPGTQNDC